MKNDDAIRRAEIWEYVSKKMDGKTRADTMSEVLKMQILGACLGQPNRKFDSGAVLIPIKFAWQIATLLEKAPSNRGRRWGSWGERRTFAYIVTMAKQEKARLMEEEEMTEARATQEAAAKFGVDRPKGKRRRDQKYAIATIIRGMQGRQ